MLYKKYFIPYSLLFIILLTPATCDRLPPKRQPMITLYLYADEDLPFVEKVLKTSAQTDISLVPFSRVSQIVWEETAHLLVSGPLIAIKEAMALAMAHEVSLGIIPRPEQRELMRTYRLPANPKEALSLALTPASRKIGLLMCDEQIVLQEAVIADAAPLDSYQSTLGGGLFARLGRFTRTLFRTGSLRHTRLQLTTAKEHVAKLSAIGLVGIGNRNDTLASKLLDEEPDNGNVSLLVLAPTSMIQYFGYLLRIFLPGRHIDAENRAIGQLRSRSIRIESERPLPVRIDDHDGGQTPVTLTLRPEALALGMGEGKAVSATVESDKERIRIDPLPRDDENTAFLSRRLPLFEHASQEQFATLFTTLRDEAKADGIFMTLLILATMIATLGLYANSGSVIIGAMLLAPLMQPIVSFSMGVLRGDSRLLRVGLRSIAVGAFTVAATSALMTMLLPAEKITAEMAGRLSPTLIDLAVAVVSGMAAAYAKSNEKIASSLAGVAIAVALVPPIAVAGIGLGWGELFMFTNAFLLFVTNLVGIVLAAALTFYVLGYSPTHIARRGLAVWVLVVGLVAVPLSQGFVTMKRNNRIEKTLTGLTLRLESKEVTLQNINLQRSEGELQIYCDVVTDEALDAADKQQIKAAIIRQIDHPAQIVATIRYRF